MNIFHKYATSSFSNENMDICSLNLSSFFLENMKIQIFHYLSPINQWVYNKNKFVFDLSEEST